MRAFRGPGRFGFRQDILQNDQVPTGLFARNAQRRVSPLDNGTRSEGRPITWINQMPVFSIHLSETDPASARK
mgnify:CR=1 FL=1